jgi:hypothetical protein
MTTLDMFLMVYDENIQSLHDENDGFFDEL